MKRVLCLWLPNWPLQRLAAARDELNGRRVLLYEAGRGGLQVVAYAPCLRAGALAVPRAEEAHGIQLGMPLAEALSLMDAPRTPAPSRTKPHIAPYDAAADWAALRELADWCRQFSPTVGIEKAARPEALLLDVRGLETCWPDERSLLTRMAERLAERRLEGRLALADTLGAARALARFALGEPWIVVPPGQTFAAIESLPLAALRLPEKTVECLAELGVERVGQLAALPRSTLSCRFGPQLLARLDQASGAADEALQADEPPPCWEARQALAHPTANRDAIDLVCLRLLAGLAKDLAARGEGVSQLACCFECPGAEEVRFSIGLYQPSSQPEHLMELVRLRLDQLRLRAPVEAVRTIVETTARLPLVQRTMFPDADSPSNPHSVANLVDRLGSRLGRGAVLAPWLLPEALPEYACHYVPLVAAAPPAGGRAASRKRPAPPKKAAGAVGRPLHLVDPPEVIHVAAAAHGGPPASFRHGEQEQRVVRAWGPERIETFWWRRRCARRDYYQVETAGGGRYWLFRCLRSRRWYLHGRFE